MGTSNAATLLQGLDRLQLLFNHVSMWLIVTIIACCCCLNSGRSSTMECTNSSKRSSCLLRSSPEVLVSFPELELAGGMVEEPKRSDTKLSWVCGKLKLN
ncbi:hypothetical protein GUJ93_ZPchr0012g20061 [Zizania palustris]|uniref:Uncharacterized protein n=1 Tax=Zizania palustris TaxID=103762 RepID=A0A8J5WNT4_ZIZPA|nr:hypothetical protein GUJ93_ZPchr0012g20061 [Zizania palustris]